uniref:Dehydrogenase/reductase SDR family member 1 n=1 Tax=Acrobeloides nanus TaxID=290746 RepID=A0A914BZF0_9BILA
MLGHYFKVIFPLNCKVAIRLFSTSRILRDPLDGQVALVTGASRGIDIKHVGGNATPIYCDHSKPEEIQKLFAQIEQETHGTLDILVNNAFSGGQSMFSNAGKKFFECDPLFWDDVNNVGLRNNYICAVYAARMMAKKKRGLIVNISAAGGIQYVFNVPYGVGKAAIDRMAADMALELKPFGITVVSLWPGTVQTEVSKIMLQKDVLHKALGLSKELCEKLVANGETPEFVGKSIAALASDPKVLKKTGKIHFTADLAKEYKFTDINGKLPPHMRSVSSALEFFGWPKLAGLVPSFIKVPKPAMHFASYKFYKF